MYDYREIWKQKVAAALGAVLSREGEGAASGEIGEVAVENPPRPDMGDLGFPMFAFAKKFRKAPAQIAALVAEALGGGAAQALGPYVNIQLDRAETAREVLGALLASDSEPGRPGSLAGQRIMLEFSSPNTNKPLHLGHLRNDAIGESLARILRACGAEVRTVCIINDRGIHICKSMLAYQERFAGKTPAGEGRKGDHFVGDCYVCFNTMSKDDKAAEERARALLRAWEAGDAETIALWKTMNGWTVAGMKETWRRTGVSFDKFYFESETYQRGKEQVLRGLAQGLFYQSDDGAVWVDLSGQGLDQKALLRSDGTSLYITQDIGTAIYRYEEWPFDRLIFVVGSEQQYHFKALFAVLGKLGCPWAKNLYHLSYGMVNVPEGRMKSREGTVVDADDLLDELSSLALAEIRERDREETLKDASGAAEKIALGALHYYLLQNDPSKDMLFKKEESLAFNGNTGPYLQYMGARIASLLKKAGDKAAAAPAPEALALLSTDAEWEVIKLLGGYNARVAAAGAALDPSIAAAYAYDLAKAFSVFYHDCPILQAPSPPLVEARLALCRAVLAVLRDAMHLVCVPFLEEM
ncbi:MAG: arginine--tRNA ligase [Treponema sp.]|jgi:arginyl-tRNA synthetase|nr:arginine--tRNA ligase [Treponema sp.]